MTDQLFQIPATHPPALEAARRRLDALIAKRDVIAADWRDSGNYAMYQDWPADWYSTDAEIRDAEREVTRLETEGRG